MLAVEKKASSILIDMDSYHKVTQITGHIGATYAGLGPDFRILMMKARKITQQYWVKYREPITGNNISSKLASTIQEFTQRGARRPFGNSILLSGYDDLGAHLYQLDPSGAFYGILPNHQFFIQNQNGKQWQLERIIKMPKSF